MCRGMFVQRSAGFVAAACVAVTAQADLVPVARVSHLVGSSGDGSTPASVNETYTAWVSESHIWPAVRETTTFSANSIAITGSVDGYSYYNQMQHYGWTRIGQYSGDFTFQLTSPASYTLNGYLSMLFGAGSLRLYNLGTGVDAYAYTAVSMGQPFSTAGELPAGQYRLHIEAQGAPMEGGAGGVSISVNLTFTPTPGTAALLALGGVGGVWRSRRR